MRNITISSKSESHDEQLANVILFQLKKLRVSSSLDLAVNDNRATVLSQPAIALAALRQKTDGSL